MCGDEFLNDLCSKQSTCSANKILKSTCAANTQPVQQMALEISSYVAARFQLNIFKKINPCGEFKQKGFILNNQPTWQTANNLWWWSIKEKNNETVHVTGCVMLQSFFFK